MYVAEHKSGEGGNLFWTTDASTTLGTWNYRSASAGQQKGLDIMECMVGPLPQVSQYVNTLMHTTETIKVILMFDWWLTKLTKNNIVSVKLPVSRMVEVDLVMGHSATMSLPLDKINMSCFKSSVLHDPLKSWIIFWKSRNEKWIWDIYLIIRSHLNWFLILSVEAKMFLNNLIRKKENDFCPCF